MKTIRVSFVAALAAAKGEDIPSSARGALAFSGPSPFSPDSKTGEVALAPYLDSFISW